jgi:hypothetical protein
MPELARRRGQPTYEVHVEELVLDGFQPGDDRAIAAALQRELKRLLQREGLSSLGQMGRGSLAVARIDAGALTLRMDSSAGEIGAAAARSIIRQIGSLSARVEAAGPIAPAHHQANGPLP